VHLPGQDEFARYRFLCSGFKCVPFFFQGTMVALRRIFVESGISDGAVLVYTDDWLLLAPTREALVVHVLRFETAMSQMGFCCTPRCARASYRSSNLLTLSLLCECASVADRHGCDSIRAQVAALLKAAKLGQRWLVTDFDSFMGKLAHAVYALTGGRVALCPMYEFRAFAARHLA